MNMSAGKVWHWPTRPLDRHEANKGTIVK
ncbi:hypothetical protein D917_08894 [Trichinella nativa]|uniref:Uncharacterized protein n=1 Tax=Trichinella nativa TaxID=6335 RepID=A0A1Y3ENK5_9BILA|nr:hypothetical protein D917_08894 [Trichinella nativa]